MSNEAQTSTTATSAQSIQGSTTSDASSSSQPRASDQVQANGIPEAPPNTPAATNGVQSANTGSDNSGQTQQLRFVEDFLPTGMSDEERQRFGFESGSDTSHE